MSDVCFSSVTYAVLRNTVSKCGIPSPPVMIIKTDDGYIVYHEGEIQKAIVGLYDYGYYDDDEYEMVLEKYQRAMSLYNA